MSTSEILLLVLFPIVGLLTGWCWALTERLREIERALPSKETTSDIVKLTMKQMFDEYEWRAKEK